MHHDDDQDSRIKHNKVKCIREEKMWVASYRATKCVGADVKLIETLLLFNAHAFVITIASRQTANLFAKQLCRFM